MTDLDLRGAQRDDAEAIARVHDEAWRAMLRGVLPDALLARVGYRERLVLWRALLERPEPPLVDMALAPEGGLAGFVWSRLVDEPGAAFDAEIFALYVLPAWQRRGVGRRLIAAAVDRLTRAGAGSAYLWVYRDNVAARGFYESLGGRIVDEGEERLEEVVVPTVAYAWRPLVRLAAACRGTA